MKFTMTGRKRKPAPPPWPKPEHTLPDWATLQGLSEPQANATAKAQAPPAAPFGPGVARINRLFDEAAVADAQGQGGAVRTIPPGPAGRPRQSTDRHHRDPAETVCPWRSCRSMRPTDKQQSA